MATNKISLNLLRNDRLYLDKEAAINGIKSVGTNDGVIKLARYKDENNNVKTIFGISYTPDSGSTTYTIYESYKEAIDAIWDTIDELKGNVSEDYNSLEKIERKVKENYQKAIVTMTATTPSESGSTIAKTYTLYQGGVTIGNIDIYKDSFLKAVQLIDKDGHVIDDEHPGIAKYIQFIFSLSDGTESVVNIPIDSFIQDLEAGQGLVVDSEGKLNIVKDLESEDFLVINEDSIAIVGVQESIDEAVQRAYDDFIEQLNAEIERAMTKEEELEEKIADIEVIGSEAIEVEKNESGRKSTVSLKLAEIDETISDNPLSIKEDGLAFASELNCGFFD